MKRFLSLIMAMITAVTCLSFSASVYALDLSQVTGDLIENAVELPCDSKWREYSGKAGTSGDFYKITVASEGKLNIKIQAYASLEATLSSADFTKDYFTALSVAASQPDTVIRNQVIPAGVYYLSVKCNGRYDINATFGGNCYKNPQNLSADTEVTGKSTENEDGWWYKLIVPSDATYIFNSSAYGNADIKLYNSNLTSIIENMILNGSSTAPASQKNNEFLTAGTYYVKVSCDSTYKLSWYLLTKKNCTHSYSVQSVKPTYLTKGYRIHTCSICGYSYKDNYTGKKTLSAPAISKLKKGSRKLTVSYGRTFYATGYQIQYSTSKKFTSKTTKKISTKDTSKTIKKLKGRTKYYVRVRAYKKIDGKTVFSSWSDVKSITVKK